MTERPDPHPHAFLPVDFLAMVGEGWSLVSNRKKTKSHE